MGARTRRLRKARLQRARVATQEAWLLNGGEAVAHGGVGARTWRFTRPPGRAISGSNVSDFGLQFLSASGLRAPIVFRVQTSSSNLFGGHFAHFRLTFRHFSVALGGM